MISIPCRTVSKHGTLQLASENSNAGKDSAGKALDSKGLIVRTSKEA